MGRKRKEGLRDKRGNLLRGAALEKILKKAKEDPAPAFEPISANGDDFLKAAVEAQDAIKNETAEALKDQAPPKNGNTEVKEDPAPEIGSTDWTIIVKPVLSVAGAALASRTEIPEMAFSDPELNEMTQATSHLLNVLWPDVEALDPKEKAIVAVSMVFLNVGYQKYMIFEKAKAKKQDPAPINV